MPVAIGWILRVLSRFGKGWLFPVFGAAAAWLIEQMTGAISWAIVRVGQGVIQVTLDFLDEIEWGDPPDWAVFGSSFLEIASESGAIAALGILVAGGVVRLVVRIVTLGRL